MFLDRASAKNFELLSPYTTTLTVTVILWQIRSYSTVTIVLRKLWLWLLDSYDYITNDWYLGYDRFCERFTNPHSKNKCTNQHNMTHKTKTEDEPVLCVDIGAQCCLQASKLSPGRTHRCQRPPSWYGRNCYNPFSPQWTVGLTTDGEIHYFHIYDDDNTLIMMASPNGNISCVTGPLCGEFTGRRWILLTQKPVTQNFDMFFHLNKQVSKQSRRRWFETPSRYLWRHCHVEAVLNVSDASVDMK